MVLAKRFTQSIFAGRAKYRSSLADSRQAGGAACVRSRLIYACSRVESGLDSASSVCSAEPGLVSSQAIKWQLQRLLEL